MRRNLNRESERPSRFVPGRDELAAAAAAVLATLAHVACRMAAAAGSPLCAPGGGSPVNALCLASGLVAAAVVVVAALVWRDALRSARAVHAR